MNKWDVRFGLKDGRLLDGYLENEFGDSLSVAKRLFDNRKNDDFVNCYGESDKSTNLFVRIGDVVCFEIGVHKGV